MKMLLAVLLGNLIYFLIAPHLPDALKHGLFHLDNGPAFRHGDLRDRLLINDIEADLARTIGSDGNRRGGQK
jgi:hypothetical protein